MSLADQATPEIMITETIAQTREVVREWKAAGESIAFVPTMGNLHAGHMALVKAANESGMRTIVSIFVNPLQFGEREDLQAYPRTFEEDIDKLSQYNIDLVFAPAVEEIYPAGKEATTTVQVPGLSDILEGEHRPGFFTGVATVVCKLFNIVEPDAAYFGEKDYQQLLVIRRMVQDLALPVAIHSVATVREQDGLAMSSRNSYLNERLRESAVALQASLQYVVKSVQEGMDSHYAVGHACQQLEEAGFDTDYVVVRNQADLSVPTKSDNSLIVLAAARLGTTRLIDNIPFELMQSH